MIPQKPSRPVKDAASLDVLDVGPQQRVKLHVEAPSVLMTIEASVARATVGASDPVLDRSGFLVVPAGTRVVLLAERTGCRVAVVSFHPPLLTTVARMYARIGLQAGQLTRWLERNELLPRTVWVHEIVHRYVFERHALGEHDNLVTRFLETELVKEIYFLFRDRDAGADRESTLRRHSPCVDRAVAYVESHLFEPCRISTLVKFAAASESTLLRSFRRELGSSPAAYWRSRKLDVALMLLRAGRSSVAEVAGHVGYDNPTVFAHAFRLRFGRPPSSFRPTRQVRQPP